MSRFVQPKTITLPLSNGDTITIRERLTHGEIVAQWARLRSTDGDGKVDPVRLADAVVLAYLVDWTFTDAQGERVPIRGLSLDEVAATLNGLDQASFVEIKNAIDQHEADLTAQKKIPAGDPASGPILHSVA